MREEVKKLKGIRGGGLTERYGTWSMVEFIKNAENRCLQINMTVWTMYRDGIDYKCSILKLFVFSIASVISSTNETSHLTILSEHCILKYDMI